MASTSDVTTQFTSQKAAASKQAAKNEKASGTGTNPGAELDKDAFMKLLLTELKHQDPTSPMDTEKMLTQTSQLATLEMQQNTNKTMTQLVEQLKSSSSMYALGSLGKMATTSSNVTLSDENRDVNFALYFKKPAKSGSVQVLDKNSKVVYEASFKDMHEGIHKFQWDGKTSSGEKIPNGTYTIRANYLGTDNNKYTTNLGTYPVEAVRFTDGKAQVKLAGEYVGVDKISEFFEG